jgi:hypothetical protein
VAVLRRTGGGRLQAEFRRPGTYVISTEGGKTYKEEIGSMPPPFIVPGPWEVRFPAGWGAPETAIFAGPMSWTEHPDAGVRHFSGTAVYHLSFVVPEGITGGAGSRRIDLDLGDVRVIARVKLNDKDLGILWMPPYRVDVTEVLRPGQNALEVQVTNLWPNRMVGDEELPEDSLRNPDGTLKEWPAWLNEGKPSPTGRFTFTSWRLWKKGDPLVPSGLLSEIRLEVAEIRDLGQAR